MPDMGPRGGKSAGGAGLISRKRSWDEGSPSAFTGRIHPFPGNAESIKDEASVKQPSGKNMPPSAGMGGSKTFPPPKNVQSAKAPRHPMPEGLGRLKSVKDSSKAIQGGCSKGPDKGPRGSGRTGGRE